MLKLLQQTEIIYSHEPESEMTSWDIQDFKNPALESMGLQVGYYGGNRNDEIIGSISFNEGDFVNIGTLYTGKDPQYIIIWPDGTQKKFDPQGNLVE